MQRDLRERAASLHPLPGNARPPCPVPQLPPHHHQGRGQVRQEVSGHDHDRGEDETRRFASTKTSTRVFMLMRSSFPFMSSCS